MQCIDLKGYRAFRKASLQRHVRVVSVDVFDTLLLRTTKPEFARFLEIGRLQKETMHTRGGCAPLRARDMLILRIMAAQAAYRNTRQVEGVREAAYETIVNIMLNALGIPVNDENYDLFMRVELGYEKDMLTPNKMLVSTLRQAREAGKRVIAVSDMYLGAPQITELISSNGLLELFDAVYASSDFGVGKSSGKLYDSVLALEDIEGKEMTHCGDNRWSDYVRAKECGVNAFFLPRSLGWRMVERLRRKMVIRQYGLGSL